jgi:hypothetical protein
MTATDVPATSTGRLEKAAEYIRAAAHADPPVTPTEVYDQVGALFDIGQKLGQHLNRCATALTTVAASPELRASDEDPDPAFTARQAAYRLSGTATERLAGMVAELNTTWSQVSALYLAEKPAADDDEVDAETLPAEKE